MEEGIQDSSVPAERACCWGLPGRWLSSLICLMLRDATCLPQGTIAYTRTLFLSARRVLRLFYFLIGSLQPTALSTLLPSGLKWRGRNLDSREFDGRMMSLRTPETRDKSTLTFPSLIGTFALSLFTDRGTKPSEFKPPEIRDADLATSLPRDLATCETKCLSLQLPRPDVPRFLAAST